MVVVYVDTETGGVLPRHPTIELGAVAMDGDVELDVFEQKIAFNEADCDPAALALNRYDRAAWVHAQSPAVTAARFTAWVRPFHAVTLTSKRTGQPYTVARWSGYNIPFDGPRLRALFGTAFCPLELLGRDVLQRVLFWADERGVVLENYKLTTTAAHFSIPTEGAHGALADARMCARVYAAVKETRP
jgi:DNA polymerase III epsilon subunit-like protein